MSAQTARSASSEPADAGTTPKPGRGAQLRVEKGNAQPAADTPVRPPPTTSRMTADVERWLDWQCRMIAGVRRGAVFLDSRSEPGTPEPMGSWPEDRKIAPVLHKLAAHALAAKRSIVKKASGDGSGKAEVFEYIAHPLFQGEQVIGVVTMILEMRTEAQRQAVLQLMQWGISWLESTLVTANEETATGASLALEASGLLARDLPLPVVGHDLCTHLAEKLQCSRVALGLSSGLQVHVVSISHQVRFDRRVARVAELEAVMEECADQESIVTLPSASDEENNVSHAHALLLLDESNGAVCSVPLQVDDELIGVLTFVREKGDTFDEPTVDLAAIIAKRIAPVLALKQRETRPGWRKTLHGFGMQARKLLGPGHLRAKITVGLTLLLLAALSTIQTDQRVSARATIEGAIQQVMAAPFAGYVRSADARAGDVVKKGQVLAVLDDRELLLEQEKWISERDKQRKEYQEALASRDRAKVSVLMARIAQAEAQMQLVEDKLRRTQMRAPFDGVVVSGDLSRALGAPVERGQQLFELVPESSYQVSMLVDEHDVADLQQGQEANLRLAGLPDQLMPLKITRLLPVASTEQGANHFRAEAQILDAPDGLRPGMQGVTKIVVGQGSMLWVWSHELVQRLQLWLWSLGF